MPYYSNVLKKIQLVEDITTHILSSDTGVIINMYIKIATHTGILIFLNNTVSKVHHNWKAILWVIEFSEFSHESVDH